MTERIQLLMKVKNLSASKFAEEIGVNPSTLSHVLLGRNNPSLDLVLKILSRFPEINTDWLLTNKGEMFALNENEIENNSLSPQEIHKPMNFQQQIDLFDSNDVKTEEKTLKDVDNTALAQDNMHNNNLEENYKNVQEVAVEAIEKEEEVLNDSNKSNEGLGVISSQIDKSKCIDKIIIFYTDHSFSLYSPE